MAYDYCSCKPGTRTCKWATWLKSLKYFSHLTYLQIRWENRLIGDTGRAAKVTVDGTDFQTVEYRPFNRGRRSHKFNGPGLRYEVALSISNCDIVHINGPFRCGEWPDVRIARGNLHPRLRPNEYYLADAGYMGPGPAIRRNNLPRLRIPEFNALMARHETINRRFKEFAILGSTYRHAEEKHGEIFRCIAVLVQIDIEHGNLLFEI